MLTTGNLLLDFLVLLNLVIKDILIYLLKLEYFFQLLKRLLVIGNLCLDLCHFLTDFLSLGILITLVDFIFLGFD